MKILIDKRLEELNKTRYWLSQQTNVSYPNLKKLCDGNSVQLSVKTLDKICTVLNCNIGDILQSEIDTEVTKDISNNINKDYICNLDDEILKEKDNNYYNKKMKSNTEWMILEKLMLESVSKNIMNLAHKYNDKNLEVDKIDFIKSELSKED